MTQDIQETIQRAVGTIRSYHAIAVVGAGVSWTAGVPLTHEMWSLLWNALDQDPATRDRLAANLGRVSSTAKNLLGENLELWEPGMQAVESSKVARRSFQHAFTRLDAERSQNPSPAHYALAELLHRKAVELVISFNWDTLLEAAYQNLYGAQLYADDLRFIKPHGDAAFPDDDWILPHQSGYVPETLISRITLLADQYPRVLLVVGYSERDPVVVEKLTGPLTDRWSVVRISPSADGELGIPLPADDGLQALLSNLAPEAEAPGWEFVKFDYQQGLEHALIGEGLGPSDVVACPSLPEVHIAMDRLRLSHYVEILGESGTGKSITAYQTAFMWHKTGMEVLRLAERSELTDDMISAASSLKRPSILVVDDAQNIPPNRVRRLFDQSNKQLKIIVVSTTPVESARPVRIAAKRAVRSLVDSLRSRHHETLAAVRSIDKTIGDSYFDTSIDRRIDLAAQEDTPWLFTFVLTGGWQRARQQVAILQDFDRVDLLLLAIAAAQLGSLDTVVSRSWIDTATKSLNRDDEWRSKALTILMQERTIIAKNDGFRCPHVQYAVVTLRVFFRDRNDEYWNEIINMLRAIILIDDLSLHGIAVLLNELWFSESFAGEERAFGTIVDAPTWQRLVERCWSAKSEEDRRGAAYLLAALLRWYPLHVAEIEKHTHQIARWIETASATSASGIGRLLNDVSQEPGNYDLGRNIVKSTSPLQVSASINELSWDGAAAWGFLLNRLGYLATPYWKSEVKASLKVASLNSLFQSLNQNNLWAMSEFFEGLSSVDKGTALRLINGVAPSMGIALSKNPVEVWQDIHSVVLFGLRMYSPGLGIPTPTPEQSRIAKQVTRSVDPASIADTLSRSRRRDWRDFHEILIFLRKTDASKASEVVALVDLRTLDETINALWSEMPDELQRLLWALFVAEGKEDGRIRSWVESNTENLELLTPRLAIIAPSAIADSLTKGGRLDLDVGKGWDWQVAVVAVAGIALVNPICAQNQLEQSQIQIAEGLSKLRSEDSGGVPTFLHIVQELAPTTLPKILAQISPEAAERHWTKLLRGASADREAAAVLIEMTIDTTYAVAEVSKRLRYRFPRASVPRADAVTSASSVSRSE